MHINVHSFYSFRYGVLSLEEIIQHALSNKASHAVLTDINTTAGIIPFVKQAKSAGVKPVIGIDFRNGAEQQFIAIAKNNAGFYEMNEYLSRFLHEKSSIPNTAPNWTNCYVVYPYKKYEQLKRKLFDHERIGISIQDLQNYAIRKSLDTLNSDKFVALTISDFKKKNDFNKHRILRAIDNNLLLSKLPKSEEGSFDNQIIAHYETQDKFEQYEFLIKNTEYLISDCTISFELENNQSNNQRTFLSNSVEDFKLLKALCEEGLPIRYPKVTEEIRGRLNKELELIKEKNFVSYFLINREIVQYARRKGYFYVGRGSGANSIVAYLLFITDVDPIDLDLYFERFINLYRTSPPDFDIDFSWGDREDVTTYIFNRFKHVALLGTHVTFQLKGAIREVGKVLGLPPHEIDQISSPDRRKPLDEMQQLVARYAQRIEGYPNHIGIHAGGILISEYPIHQFTATSLPPKGYPTTHFDMNYAEDIGLHKFDILSQRGLGKIKDALQMVNQKHPEITEATIRDMPALKQDKKIKDLLRNGKTIGCFYVESPAMRMLLTKLQVDDYLGLVAASSIIRPGVAKSGMMREYILRHRYPERRKNAHPKLMEIMPETYGIMVYQEDVIKVAHYFAGLSLGEADVLRRAMSGKFRSRDAFQRVKEQFFNNCKERNYDSKDTNEIWLQIESFAGYAFAKGHSASYAVESYQSLYFKAYYPLEYITAILNNGGGFYRTELYVHEARMHGATIEAPCVNRSEALHHLIHQSIFISFGLIKGLQNDVIERILVERNSNGKYASLEEFIDRVPISLEQLSLLIKIDAFRSTGIQRKKLLWKAHLLLNKKEDTEQRLFTTAVKDFQIPDLYHDPLEDAFEQIELIGFPLISPFELLAEKPKNALLQSDFKRFINKEMSIYGYLISIKRTRTSSSQTMSFGTFIDQEGHFIDTVHFPPSIKAYPFKGSGIYKITGKVIEEFDFLSLEVSQMDKVLYRHDPRLG